MANQQYIFCNIVNDFVIFYFKYHVLFRTNTNMDIYLKVKGQELTFE